MQSAIKKIKLIYIPFLIIAISFIIIYTFLNWLFFIKNEIFSVKENIINFWIPFGLPWIPVLIWLRPRIALLQLKGANGNKPFLFQFVAAIAIAVPAIITQMYIEKESGKLTQLTTIHQINKVEKAKYYQLKNFYIDKKNIGVYPYFEVGGKHNENFGMHLYVTLPILDNQEKMKDGICSAWLGIEYSKTISNRLNDEEKQKEFKNFDTESEKDFDNKNINQFVYLERYGNTDDSEHFKESVKQNRQYNSIDAPVLRAVNEPFENRTGNYFVWIFRTFGIGSILLLILILSAKFDQTKLRRFERGNKIPDRDLKDMLSLLKPQESHLITQCIVFVNVLVFIIMIFSGLGFISFTTKDLLNWGGNFRPSIINGEWWRLLTNIFLHGGVMHLVSNMFGLIIVGLFLEPVLGRIRYLSIYLITGIFASLTSVCWYDATVSIGASGAIFGLYGIFLAFLLTKIFPPDFSKAFLVSTLIYIGYNLLMGLTGGIDNAAHLGGLVSGFIIGLILSQNLKKKLK